MCTLVSDLAPDGSCHFLRQQHVALPPLMLVVAHQGKVGVCVSVGVCVCVSVCLQKDPKSIQMIQEETMSQKVTQEEVPRFFRSATDHLCSLNWILDA